MENNNKKFNTSFLISIGFILLTLLTQLAAKPIKSNQKQPKTDFFCLFRSDFGLSVL